MKKLISLVFAAALAFALAVGAFAAETPQRLFVLDASDGVSYSEAAGYAAENGFSGVLLDLRGGDEKTVKAFAPAEGESPLSVYLLTDSASAEAFAKTAEENGNLAGIILPAGEATEEILSSLSEKFGSERVGLFLPFGDDEAFEGAKGLSAGIVFAENLLSSYSEHGYEEYLEECREAFPDSVLITVNDLGRVLAPVVRGDFFGDAFELNNQYLINRLNGIGFCVSDYGALLKNANGSAGFLTAAFESGVLDEHADFSVSSELEITRPTKSSLTVSTYKYTIFGTSDPEKQLYMDGAEVERISKSGLFAVTVDVPKSGKTFTFSQGDKSVSVTLKRSGSDGSSAGTTSKLTSCSPSSSVLTRNGETLTLACIGPSGATVYAEIGGQKHTLKQNAAANPGVPAWFSKEITVNADVPEAEVASAGKVVYTLVYGGSTKTYESGAEVFVAGENARLAVRAATELAGVEKEPKTAGNYVTTLRTGCADYVTEEANGWYKLSCGGYISASHSTVITGKVDLSNRISSAERKSADGAEMLVLKCSSLPAFEGKINGKVFSIKLYNTEWSDFSSTDMDFEFMYRVNPVDNGDGSVTLNIFSKCDLWGWDVFTDEEAGTFTVVLKKKPVLSDDPAKPLSGIKIAVCPGHGGTDPGALSVAGEQGVNEAQINLANSKAIAESLENLGAEIVFIAAQDEKLDTYGRTNPAREALVDVYICCHANSVAENANANLWCGTQVYYHYDSSAEFSDKLANYISSATRRDHEGSIQDYYSVTRLTLCPAVMLEVGFISNPAEFESLIDKVDIQKTALAVTKAVIEICDN